MIPPERRNLEMANLNRLRWFAVWLPTLFVAILLLGEHFFEYGLPQSYDFHLYTVHLPMVGAVAIGAYVFSTLTFRTIRRTREEILRREQEVVALEKRFRALVENSSDMTVLLTAEGVVRYLSASVTRILGYNVKEKVGSSVLELVHPYDREQVQKDIWKAAHATSGIVGSTFRIYDNTGTPHWISVLWNNLLADPDVGAIVCNARDITGWKEAEDALRSLSEGIPIGLYRTTPSGEFLDANPALLHMLRYPDRESLVATNANTVYVNPTERRRWQELMVRDGTVEDFEFQARRLDGAVVWLKDSARAVRDDTGRILHYQGAIEDITARKRAEKTLQDRQSQLAAILHSAMDAILTIGADGRIILFNAAAERMFRCPAAKAIGQPAAGFLSEELLAGAGGSVPKPEQPGAPAPNGLGGKGHRGRRATGEEFPIEAAIWKSESGGETFCTIIVRDVGERSRAEDALRKLSSAVEHAADSVFITDRNGAIDYVNRAFEKITGYSRSEAVGKMARFLHSSVQDEPSYEDLQSTLLPGDVIRFVFTYRMKDGQLRLVEESIAPVMDNRGNVTHFAHSGHDVTERVRGEREIRESREQLRALAARLESVREEERTRIAREIHDELGQMLTGLKFDLSWLGSRIPKDSPSLQERVTAMLSLTDSTIASVRRISSELRPGLLDDLGLGAAVEWLAQDFRSRTGIDCALESGLDTLALDTKLSTAVFRILQEALTNVARHSGATRVAISIRRDDGRLTLTVKDDGRGISEAEVAGKTSLGLVGMRERVLLLGGEVRITGEPGKGTTVTARLPLGQPEGSRGARPAAAPGPREGDRA